MAESIKPVNPNDFLYTGMQNENEKYIKSEIIRSISEKEKNLKDELIEIQDKYLELHNEYLKTTRQIF